MKQNYMYVFLVSDVQIVKLLDWLTVAEWNYLKSVKGM